MDSREEVQGYGSLSSYSMGMCGATWFPAKLTRASDVVFCGGLSFLLFYRLSYVEMVRRPLPLLRSAFEVTAMIIFHRLLFYTPSATFVRLLTTNFLIAYITSWVLYFSGASEDPRMLLPAWVSITTVCFEARNALVEADEPTDSDHDLPSDPA